MVSMSVMPRGTEWTVGDLDLVPDDGMQYELLDGVLLVTPAPIPLHQLVCGNLYLLLRGARTGDLQVFFAPVDWRPDIKTSLQPDLLVVRRTDVGPKYIDQPLVLAVEILSPSTRRKDQILKRSKYQERGIQSYWMVDPVRPSIEVLELIGGRYASAAFAVGEDVATITRPFPMAVRPADLLRP